MRSGTFLTAGGLAAALLLLAGCPLDEKRGDDWVPVAQGSGQGDVNLYRDVAFGDIPLPVEYVVLTRHSYSFQGSHFRNAIIHAEGQLEWTQALAYFRNTLPQHGWTLEKMDTGYDFRIFRFRKGPEQLLITVRQMRNGSRAELQLDNMERNDLLLKGKLPNAVE